MNIKNLLKAFSILCMITFSIQAKAISVAPISGRSNDDSMQIIQMEKRVNEIQNMDVQDMSSGQKKELKSELKQMLKQARGYDEYHHSHSGVYLSVGAIIVIILLLILIL